MIVTVTPNPSIDRTVTLPGTLTRGAVHRIRTVTDEPGGKGVNVARALGLAGLHAVAVLPAAEDDPILTALRAAGADMDQPRDALMRRDAQMRLREGLVQRRKARQPGGAPTGCQRRVDQPQAQGARRQHLLPFGNLGTVDRGEDHRHDHRRCHGRGRLFRRRLILPRGQDRVAQ